MKEQETGYEGEDMAYALKTIINLLSEEELSIIRRYGKAFEKLMNGERAPETEAQKRFIKVCRGELLPETLWEKAWSKYLGRLEYEADPANRHTINASMVNKCVATIGGDTWCTREGVREMRNAGYDGYKYY